VHILLAWLLPAVLPNGNAPDGTRRHEGPETAPSSWTMQHKIAPDARGVTHNPPVDGSSPSRPTPPDQGVCFRPRVPGASRGPVCQRIANARAARAARAMLRAQRPPLTVPPARRAGTRRCERWRGVTEDGRDDHRLHASAAELGGDGVAHIVQAGVGMHTCLASQALEGARERVRVNEEAVASVADEGDRSAELVDPDPAIWARARCAASAAPCGGAAGSSARALRW